MAMTNDEIREEIMEHIEFLKMLDICNKANMQNTRRKSITLLRK